MRSLHTPVHPKLIFAKDWILMSDVEKEKAEKEGKVRLPTMHEFRQMKPNEFQEWKAQVQPYLDEIHDSVLKLFQKFPKSLMLICRFKL
jgi:hypothetical protein